MGHRVLVNSMCPSGGLPVAGSTGVSGLSAQGSRTEEVGMPVQFPCLLLKELWHLHWQRDTPEKFQVFGLFLLFIVLAGI